jgi:hypothetical protein
VAPIVTALREVGASVDRPPSHGRTGTETAQIKASIAELPGGVVGSLIDELTD